MLSLPQLLPFLLASGNFQVIAAVILAYSLFLLTPSVSIIIGPMLNDLNLMLKDCKTMQIDEMGYPVSGYFFIWKRNWLYFGRKAGEKEYIFYFTSKIDALVQIPKDYIQECNTTSASATAANSMTTRVPVQKPNKYQRLIVNNLTVPGRRRSMPRDFAFTGNVLLIGPSGCGKTKVATQVANAVGAIAHIGCCLHRIYSYCHLLAGFKQPDTINKQVPEISEFDASAKHSMQPKPYDDKSLASDKATLHSTLDWLAQLPHLLAIATSNVTWYLKYETIVGRFERIFINKDGMVHELQVSFNDSGVMYRARSHVIDTGKATKLREVKVADWVREYAGITEMEDF